MTTDIPDAEDPVLGIDQSSYDFTTSIGDTLTERFPDQATHTPTVTHGIHVDRLGDVTIDNALDVAVRATIYERIHWRTAGAPGDDAIIDEAVNTLEVPAGGSVTRELAGAERPHFVRLEAVEAPSAAADVTVTFDNPQISGRGS